MRKLSVAVKVLAPIALLFILPLALMTLQINRMVNDIYYQSLKARALELADSVTLAIEADLSPNNFLRVATSLGSAEDIEYVMLLNADSKEVIAASNYRLRRPMHRLPADIQAHIDAAVTTTPWRLVEGDDYRFTFSYHIRTIAPDKPQVVTYVLLLQFNGAEISDLLVSSGSEFLLYVSISMAIMFCLAYWLFYTYVLTPLAKLRRSLRLKKPGEAYRELDIHSHDEFHLLALVLKRMAKTEQRSLRMMQEAKAKAESTARIKSAFLANMSHEIRTPINGILGLAQVAQRSNNLQQVQQYISKILNSGQALIAIINDILDFSKLSAGKVVIEHIDFCPDDVLEHVQELSAQQVTGKPVALIFEVQPDLPIMLNSDPLRIGQVLLNLVNNAVKFTEQGEVRVKVSWYKAQDSAQQWLSCQVSDTGIGINPQQQKRLFDEFSQADDSTTRRFGGTGLGLAICKKLVLALGGDIEVDSVMGRGSQFRFSVPVAPCGDNVLQKTMMQVAKALDIQVDADINASGQLADPVLALLTRLSRFKGGVPVRVSSQVLMAHEQDSLREQKPLQEPLQERDSPVINTPSLPTLVLGANEHYQALALPDGQFYPLSTQLNRATVLSGLLSILTQQQDAEQSAAETSPQSTVQILLVEDNAINAEVVIAMLSDEMVVVTHVENGEEAVDFLKNKTADMVLMDIQMPVMDGYAATQVIREHLQLKLPIIGLSANVLPEEVAKAKQLGMNDYLAKPVMRDQLLGKINRWRNA